MPAPRIYPDYRFGLILCLEEEISGETWFEALAEAHQGQAAASLSMLAEMERVTAGHLRPVVAAAGFPIRDEGELRASGRAEAEPLTRLSWPELIAYFCTALPPYMNEFDQLMRLAPDADRPVLQVLADHEQAAIDFAEAEARGDAGSQAPLRAFLAAWGGGASGSKGRAAAG